MGKGRRTIRQRVAQEADVAIEEMRARAEFRKEFIARRGIDSGASAEEIDNLIAGERRASAGLTEYFDFVYSDFGEPLL